MLKNHSKKIDGFTLVELLVVIAIIGLLVTISVIAMQSYQKKAVDIRVQASLNQIRNIAAMIYTDNSNYNSLCDVTNTLNQNQPSYKVGLRIIEDDVYNFTGEYPICYAVGPDFCVQTSLVAGDSFCLDSNGYIGEGENECKQNNIKCTD